MKLLPLPDGRPVQHLGIRHTLKHYLAPAECWGDLVDDFPEDVPPSAMPDAVRGRLPQVEPPPWAQPNDRMDPALVDHWHALRVPYRKGYLRVVTHFAERVPSPDEAPSRWVRSGTQAMPTCQLGGTGILLRVKRKGDGWQLYSAFRPAGFRYFEKQRPQTDPRSVSLRRRVAAIRANTAMDRWRTDGDMT